MTIDTMITAAADPRPDPSGDATLTDIKVFNATGAWRSTPPTMAGLRRAMTAYLAWGDHRRGKWQVKPLARIALDFAGLVPEATLLEWIEVDRPKVAAKIKQDAAKANVAAAARAGADTPTG